MPINPSIALGVRPVEMPNPLNALAQFSQIQNAQNQNALAQYQLSSAQRQDATQKAMEDAYAGAIGPNGEIDYAKLKGRLAASGAGSKVQDIEKQRLDQTEKQSKIDKERVDLVDAKLKQSRQFLDTIDPADPNAPISYLQWHQANHADPVLGPTLAARGVTQEQALDRIKQALQQPGGIAQLIAQSKLGVEKFAEMNKPQYMQQRLGGMDQVVSVPGLGGAATVVPGSVAQVTQSPDSIASNQRMAAEAAASRAQAERHFQANQVNAGNQYDAERGLIVNTRSGTARPAVFADGAAIPPKDKPLPEAAQKQLVGVRNLQSAVDNYTEKMSKFGLLDMAKPDTRAAMGNAYNNMMLQAKEAYNLGVLNGPDYEILQSVVKDPTKFTSLAVSKDALVSQANELKRISQGIEKTVLESHGKKYAPPADGAKKPDQSGLPSMAAIEAEIARRRGGK